MKFRLQSKNLFLTFPKLELEFDLTSVIEKIKNKEKNIKYILICKELHKDKTLHSHLFLHYTIRKNVQNPNYFNYIFSKHGDYQTVKSIKNSIDYIKKEGDFIEWGNPPSYKSETLEDVLNKVKKGELDAYTIIKEDKLDVVSLFNKINQIDKFEKRLQHLKREQQHRAKNKLNKINLSLFNNELLKVLTVINNNLKNRRYKEPMLHIWSREPNTGKTSLINFLYDKFPCYIWPDDMWFQDYKNNVYQFIVWDEFNLYGWQIEFMNRFFAGNSMSLPVKGSHAYKEDNPLIIMTSNQPLEEHIFNKYKQSHKILRETALKTLSTRVHEIEIKSPLFVEYDRWLDKMNKSIS